jgi:NAD(P)H-hydrate epimerase
VTALLAQGLPALEAAALGAYLHGYAGDRLAARTGPAGLLAGDLAREIPAAAEALRQRAREAGETGGGRLRVAFPDGR